MKDQQRLEQIKTKLLEEKSLAKDLESKFTQVPLKEQAHDLTEQIWEIEVTYLSDENLNRYRTPDMEGAFLELIERAVDVLVSKPRVLLESALEKYGPDVTRYG